MQNNHVPMRKVFGEYLLKKGKTHTDLVALDADVSSSTQTKLFASEYPERFINCGIAEGNMISVAAGIAAAGLRPLASSFAFLLAARAADQIRSQIAYCRLPVIIAGGYSGLSDHADGGSHQSIEDISFFLTMPNMTVICPGDATEVEMALDAALEYDGPVYIRLSRAEVRRLPYKDNFAIGRALVRRQGKDVALISTGHILENVLAAAEELEKEGVEARVVDLHTPKPLDEDEVLAAAGECGAIVTCEEHSIIGGAGSMIASFLARNLPVPMRMVGIKDAFGQSALSYKSLQEHYGLGVKDIVAAAHDVLTDKGKMEFRKDDFPIFL